MVQEKLKRSTKQPRAAPEAAAAAAVVSAAAPRMRPGAFVPREPAGAGPMAVDSPAGTPYGAASSGSEGDAVPPFRGYGGGVAAAAAAQDGLHYHRQAFTPPNALATPLPARPGSAYAGPGAAGGGTVAAAHSVAPTPVPGARPFMGALCWLRGGCLPTCPPVAGLPGLCSLACSQAPANHCLPPC